MVCGCSTAGPNTALVKSGACLATPQIVVGGFMCTLPYCQEVKTLDLSLMTIEISSPHVYSEQGVPVSVSSIAQIKISRFPESLRNAASQFLGMSRNEVEQIAQQTLEGHQRAIISTLSVEEIFQDRKKFAQEVRDVAGVDLGNLGMEICSYTIKDVSDDQGYLESLGKKRTAEVKRDARIGEAEAERDAVVKESEAKNIEMKAKLESETAIADSKRKYELNFNQFAQEVNAKNAEAALAGELQSTKEMRKIKEETMQIGVIERRKQIRIEEEEVKRKEKELDATVKKPAEAERIKLETLAEGNRLKTILEAEGAADARLLIGEAEATVLRAKGEAEAFKMSSKAEAWKAYSDTAFLDMIIRKLPDIAGALAKPLEKTDKILVLSGAQDPSLSSTLTQAFAKIPPVVDTLSGVDLNKALANFVKPKA